jgi:acyl-CoA thioester hydrolase
MELIRSEHLPDYPIAVQIPIAWGEMDAYGHVNNIVFFRHFESVRIAFLDHIGFRNPADNAGVGPILHSTQCRFRRPLSYPDTVHVGARIEELTADRFTMAYRMFGFGQKQVVADGSGIIVSYNYDRMEKAELPSAVLRRIEALR